MLNSVHPLSFVETTVQPVHFSVATPHISFIISFVEVTTLPCELTVSPFFIILVVAFVLIAFSWSFFPEPFAFSETVEEVTFEVTFVCPVVSSLTRGSAVGIVASVHIQIRKLLHSNSIFQCLFEFAFVDVSISLCQNPKAFRFATAPLSIVNISVDSLPQSRPMSFSLPPLSFVSFTVGPSVAT